MSELENELYEFIEDLETDESKQEMTEDQTKDFSAYSDFIKAYLSKHKGSTIADAAKAWSKEKKGKVEAEGDDIKVTLSKADVLKFLYEKEKEKNKSEEDVEGAKKEDEPPEEDPEDEDEKKKKKKDKDVTEDAEDDAKPESEELTKMREDLATKEKETMEMKSKIANLSEPKKKGGEAEMSIKDMSFAEGLVLCDRRGKL